MSDIDKKYELVYQSMANRYRYEWESIDTIDSKINNIIGYVGIILTLEAGLGSLFIKNTSFNNINPNFLYALFFSGIISLILSITCGLWAYYIKDWQIVPKPSTLIEECINNKDILPIYFGMSKAIANSITDMKKKKDDKANRLMGAFIFLIIGIIVNVLFAAYGLGFL